MDAIKTKKIVLGSALGGVEFTVGAVISLALTPFIIHSLGDKLFGLWTFLCSFLGYYAIMDFGLGWAAQRYIAQAIGANDRDEMNGIVNTSLALFVVLGGIVLALAVGFAAGIPLVVKNVTEVRVFRISMLILGVSMGAGFPLSVFSGILTAHLRYDLKSTTGIIKFLIRSLLIVVFLLKGYGIITLAFISLVSDIGQHIVNYVLVRRLFPYITLSAKLINVARTKKLFSYSLYNFVAMIGDQLRLNIDNFVIVVFIGLAPVTLYTVGARLIRNFLSFMGGCLEIIMPMFSQHDGEGDYDAIARQFLFSMKISTYLAILIGGTLVIFGKAFIIRWVGPEYVNAYCILIILLIPFTFDVMQLPGHSVLYGLSKHKYYAGLNSVEGICNLILSLVLVRKYGIYGVAMGTAIPMFVAKIFVQPIFVCKVVGLPYRHFYINLMLPLLMRAIGILTLFWLLVRSYIVPEWLNIGMLIFMEVFVYTALIYYFGFNSLERKKYFRPLFIGIVK